MAWHLLVGSPGYYEVPSTHRYREISHHEFRNMAKYLEEYQQSGKIQMLDSLCSQIMKRLSRLDVRFDKDGLGTSDHRMMPNLERDDFVLVFHPFSYGMYIHIAYATASDSKFEEMVETGIIEPVDSTVTEPIRMRSIANEIVALNKRIEEADKMLLENSGDHQKTNVGKLLGEYKKEKEKLLQNEILKDIDKVVHIVMLHKTKKEAALTAKEELAVRLQIEQNVNDDLEQQKMLRENLKILQSKIEICDEAINSLQALLAEL